MEWLINSANLMSMILCAIILDCYFSIFGTKRTNKKYIIALYNLAYIIIGLICNIFIKNQIAFIVTMFILTIAYSFAFKMQVFKRMYTTISIQIILILSEFLFSLLLSIISGLTPEELATNIIVYMTAVALSKVTIFAIIKPVSIHQTNKTIKIPKQILIGFVILPITSFVVMFYMTKALYVTNDLAAKIIGFCISLLLVLSNIVIFFLFENLLRIADREKEIMKKSLILENEKQYYSDLYEKQSASDKTMHDLKHKFYAFKDVLDNDVDKAKNLVDEIYSELKAVGSLKIIGKASVDTLLNNKIKQAKEQNIDITVTSLLTEKINIDDIDLCVILGNLIDNCIEACVIDNTHTNKWILVKFKQDDNKLMLKVENPFDESIKYVKTNKKDKTHHGFGLQNVKDIVAKYNGYYLAEIIDGVYTTTIILEMS